MNSDTGFALLFLLGSYDVDEEKDPSWLVTPSSYKIARERGASAPAQPRNQSFQSLMGSPGALAAELVTIDPESLRNLEC